MLTASLPDASSDMKKKRHERRSLCRAHPIREMAAVKDYSRLHAAKLGDDVCQVDSGRDGDQI
jgi:hypothetical protein